MIKISELPAASALGGTEIVAGVQSSTTVKILISAIGTYVRALFTATPATLAEGGTNAATAAGARTSLGLGTMAVETAADYMTKAILTTTGDTLVASAANTPARLAALASVAAHATTMNLWAARENVLTGGIVTVTDIADAPYAGAVTWVKMNDAHIWDDGAVFNIQGGADYTAAADDWLRIYATTVSTFEVTIFKASGVATVVSGGITLGSPTASTSGTAIDYTSIPAGTKRVTVHFVGVSSSGTSQITVQIGDSGGIEATNYEGVAFGAQTAGANGGHALSTGFDISNGVEAANTIDGSMSLELVDSSTNTWNAQGGFSLRTSTAYHNVAGTKSLSGVLDRIRITTAGGADTFDAGKVNITYES